MAYNKHKSFEDNVRAIETALTVLSQKRKATDKEKETLSLYSGFGGIKEVLNIGTEKPIPQNIEEPANCLLTALCNFSADNPEWYSNTIDSIKTSVLTAFYTPAFIINAVARQIQSTFNTHNLTMRTFLEPSAGIGGFLPVAMNGTKSYAFEKDTLTGIILSLLNDDTETYTTGFESIEEQQLEHTSFDVIASNIPFGNFRVFDADLWKKGGIHEQATKTIHNYFFVKALELLNEGGLLAFITSRGIADTPGNRFVREYLVNNANLISAVRLPDNIFMQTGGIEVGSDLLIFQKNTAKSGPTSREAIFLQTSREKYGEENTEYSNRLFTMPKTTLATDSRIATNQFGKLTRRYSWSGNEASMSDYLKAILKYDFDRNYRPNLFSNPEFGRQQTQISLFGDLDIPTAKGRRGYTGEMPDWFKEGALVVFEGQVGTLVYRKSSHYEDIAVDFMPVDNGNVNIERANDYMPLRSAYFELSNKEREEKNEQAELRERLNSLYDAFTAKWGFFHDNDNKEFISLDSLGNEVLTLEMTVGREIYKSDIMREPVAFKKVDASVRLLPLEALASSLNYHGKIDMDYMCQTADMTEDEITEALKGEIFYNPVIDRWEHKGCFIGGDIVTKLRDVTDMLPFLNDRKRTFAEISAKALSNAIPELVPYEELDINMGERWIDPKIYASFASYLFGVDAELMYFDINDTYMLRLLGYSAVAYNTYSVRSCNGEDIFVHALHDTVPEFTKDVYVNGEKTRVADEDAIQEAATKIQEIRSMFRDWLDRQPLPVRDRLVAEYNSRFNCYVRPSYDGSAQTFPGLTFEHFPYDSLYPSQKDAIWMIKQNGGGICWHEVGTGKTMIMCVAAYEMKRLGIVNKPMIIGLKSNVHEIADTFRKAYPMAKILYPGREDFTPSNRKEIFSQIKNNNWDCVILTHDQFSKIPQSQETMMSIFREELADVERCLEVIENSTMRYRSSKMQSGLEKRQENLKAKLAELRYSIDQRKDNVLDFNTMGIDHIFVDECHAFKNLMLQTRHTRVAGIGNTKGSQRAMNLLFAIRDIQRRTGRDLGATFLSGTVVVNALTELYVMFKYLRPQELKKQRISCFDAWAAIYTEKKADYELNVTGNIKRKERFRSYIKVPELASFLREITDYRTTDMINLDVPEKNVRFLSNPPTIEQEEMAERLVSFAKSGEWADLGLDMPEPDNLDKAKMLIATNVARKMSLDMRLFGDKFSDDPDNKASICARTVYDYYVRSNTNKGTQFIFSDLSTYKPGEWNIYQDIKDKLVALGIPSDEIQFIQCAKTERARKKLFADMNSGRVRVLFGSTTMLGTGVNAQERAVAVHHLEIPWRPADMEQRNGRAVRKGNTVKLWGENTVDIVIYGTEKTLDAYKFNLLKNKQMFINQINNGTIALRRIDEDGIDEENGMNFAEFVAILSGNTDLLQKAKLDNRILQLEKERSIFKKERSRAERKMSANQTAIATAEDIIEKMNMDYRCFASRKNDAAVTLISGTFATPQEIGRELHRISKSYRGAEHKAVGSYMGLPMTVRSEFNIAEMFERNIFFIEGASGLKYRCSQSGALPLSFAEAAAYPCAVMERMPARIAEKEKEITKLRKEMPVLEEIISRKWPKTPELETLKAQCRELQQKIEEDLKNAEKGISPSDSISPDKPTITEEAA